MKTPDARHVIVLGLWLMGACILNFPAWAQPGGQVAYLSGTLTATKAGSAPRLLTEKSAFGDGDLLSTAQDSYARLKFADGSEIALRPSTTLNVQEIRFDEADVGADSFIVGLVKGGMRAVTGVIGKRSRQKVSYGTPVATIGIRGTHFGLMLCQADDCKGLQTLGGKPLKDGLYADQAAGSTEIGNKAGLLVLDAGHFAYVADGNTPPQEVGADDAFRVTLPFSVLFDENAQIWSEGIPCGACVMH